MADKKVIAVLGSTGSQGGGLVRAILADPAGGFAARAITRDVSKDKATGLKSAGAEVVKADLDDVESLKKAFAGAYGVYAVTNFWEHFSGDKEKVQAKNIADAAKAAEGEQKKDDATAKKEAEPDKEMEKVIAERKRLEQENQRKLDEYEAQLKKGEQAVKDLNLRFGDWYFDVPDDVFQKVRLSRDKVIKKKEKKAEGDAAAKDAAAGPAGIPGLPTIPGATK